MEILCHVHDTWRKIGDFYDKRICWNEKRRLLQPQPSLSSALRIMTSLWHRVKRAPIGSSIAEIPIIKHCTMLTNIFRKKCSLNFRHFFTDWQSLAAYPSELLVSNWWCLMTLVKQFNRAKELIDILCRYGDIMSRTWYPAEDRRFLW